MRKTYPDEWVETVGERTVWKLTGLPLAEFKAMCHRGAFPSADAWAGRKPRWKVPTVKAWLKNRAKLTGDPLLQQTTARIQILREHFGYTEDCGEDYKEFRDFGRSVKIGTDEEE